jgi:GAF domain-containing protein
MIGLATACPIWRWVHVSDTRLDELERLLSASEAIESLLDIIDSDEPVAEVLHRVAVSAAAAIPDADVVSITVLGDQCPYTAACTDERIRAVDDAQYLSERGPCLEAASTQRPVRVMTAEPNPRWPEFAAAAARNRVGTSLSMPLMVDKLPTRPQMFGSLNIYSENLSAFDPFDEGLMHHYTAMVVGALNHGRRWRSARETIAQLESALLSRADIDQAKGALRAIHGCNAEEAFERLKIASQQRNVKLHAVARELLDSLSREVS